MAQKVKPRVDDVAGQIKQIREKVEKKGKAKKESGKLEYWEATLGEEVFPGSGAWRKADPPTWRKVDLGSFRKPKAHFNAGERMARARFTSTEVCDIRKRYAEHESAIAIAASLNVHPVIIHNIVRRKTYKDVECDTGEITQERISRSKRGTRNHNAAFTDTEVDSVRSAYVHGEAVHSIANRFGVSKHCIQRLIRKKSYADNCETDGLIKVRPTGRPPTKLSDEDVRAIRSRHENGESQSSLAREFGISSGMASLVCRRKTRKNVL